MAVHPFCHDSAGPANFDVAEKIRIRYVEAGHTVVMLEWTNRIRWAHSNVIVVPVSSYQFASAAELVIGEERPVLLTGGFRGCFLSLEKGVLAMRHVLEFRIRQEGHVSPAVLGQIKESFLRLFDGFIRPEIVAEVEIQVAAGLPFELVWGPGKAAITVAARLADRRLLKKVKASVLTWDLCKPCPAHVLAHELGHVIDAVNNSSPTPASVQDDVGWFREVSAWMYAERILNEAGIEFLEGEALASISTYVMDGAFDSALGRYLAGSLQEHALLQRLEWVLGIGGGRLLAYRLGLLKKGKGGDGRGEVLG